MKRVLHLIHYAGNGGSENYLFNVISHLQQEGYFFLVAYSQDGPLIKKLAQSNVMTFKLTMRNVWDIKAAYEVAKLVKRHHIEIIHTHFLRENCIAILSKLFIPKTRVIWTCHIMNDKSRWIQRANSIFTLFNQRIIAVAESVKQFLLEEGIRKDKIVTIYNGVDTDFFSPQKNSLIRQEFSIDEKIFCISCVARLSKEKGQLFLLEALGRLKKQTNLPFRCILIGDGPLKQEVEEKIQKENLQEEVILAGYRKDVLNFLNNSDIVAAPSETEALSLSIVEALSCQVPVVATKVGGNPEIIENNKTGFLVEYGNVEQFKDSLLECMENEHLLQGMQQHCRKAAVERFSIHRMLKELGKLYTLEDGK